jgi:hypothetical protein
MGVFFTEHDFTDWRASAPLRETDRNTVTAPVYKTGLCPIWSLIRCKPKALRHAAQARVICRK